MLCLTSPLKGEAAYGAGGAEIPEECQQPGEGMEVAVIALLAECNVSPKRYLATMATGLFLLSDACFLVL
jgi:hypothetical protein